MVSQTRKSGHNSSRRLEKQLAKRQSRSRAIQKHGASKRSRAKQQRSKTKRLVIRLGIAALLLLIIVMGSAFAWIAKDLPSAEGIRNRAVPESTKIYDRHGELLFEFFGEERRTSIPFDEMPEYVIQATVAVEDADFYKHHGVDFSGIFRAVFKNITGGSVQGGSTITQQLVKNAIVGGERSYIRKVRELILAIEIEQKFSKDEILQLYLNEIPYGSNAYGIEAAAQTYFDKHAEELSLAESATLAGMPQSPSYFSPFGPNKDALLWRKDFVLDRMTEEGMISEDEAEEAKAEELAFTESKIEIKAPHFVFLVRELLEEEYGVSLVEKGGLQVTTTLDLNRQNFAQKAVKEGAARNAASYNANNASLVSIEPSTGQIIAYVGSRDYFDDEIDGSVDINRSLQQMGSSFKPFVYAAAFEKGYPDTTVLYDVNTTFEGNYKPKNYDLGQQGPVSMRKGLAGSRNLTAVKSGYLVGVEGLIDFTSRLGITTFTSPENYGLAMSLGAVEEKLVEHAYAFSVLANEGKRVDRTAILKVEDPSGKVLQEWQATDGEQVVDRNVALTISDVMGDDGARAYVFGNGSVLTLPDRKVAAKTGTTEDSRDNTTVMYTPQLATAVWVGNNDNTSFPGGTGLENAAPIVNQFMREALAGFEPEWYPSPEPISNGGKPVLAGRAGVRGDKVRVSKIDGKLAPGDLPSNYVEEKEFTEHHSILHWINKDNPLGGGTSRSDPLYDKWEKAVVGWSKGKENGAPPKETSPYGAAEVQPTISILQPSADSIVSDDPFTIVATASAVAGIEVVDFAINGTHVGSATAEPFSVSVPISVSNGFHTISASVRDKYGGTAETSHTIQIKIDSSAPTAVMTTSVTGLTVDVDGTSSTDNQGIASYAWDFGDGNTSSEGTASHTYATPGDYTITLVVTDTAGLTGTTTKTVTVT